MTKQIYITTSIPYVNANPHVGHAQEFVLADCLARLYRKHGHKVILQTGTDENAYKNVLAAKHVGIATTTFVTQKARVFRDLIDKLDISATHFIRTTEERHALGVAKFFSELNPDDLYESSYTGLYCVGCEDFYQEKDLYNGLCPDHGKPPVLVSETNIFFRLTKYSDQLLQLITDGTISIYPAERRNEVIAFIKQGLRDISLTRARSRTEGWGITLPHYPTQVVYVWIDALINYLTGQGYGVNDNWQTVWHQETQKIHVIGKNVWKFHAVYWPALLLSAGLPVPNNIIVHGFLTVDGTKISKSLGNAVDPLSLITNSADPLRHYLLSAIPTFSDADFSAQRLRLSYENELANKLGNLYSRLIVLVQRAYGENISFSNADNYSAEITGDFNLQRIYQGLWGEIDRLNAAINDAKPWELLKKGQVLQAQQVISDWLRHLACLAYWLDAFLPNTGSLVYSSLTTGSYKNEILFPKGGHTD